MLLFSLGGIDLPLTKQTTPIITMMTTQASTTPMINTLLSLSLLLSTVRVDPPTFPSPKALVVVGVVEGVDVVVKEAVVTIIVVVNGDVVGGGTDITVGVVFVVVVGVIAAFVVGVTVVIE